MEVQTHPTDPLLSEQQAATFLGVKPTTLQVWRSTKRYALGYIKVGRLVRYRQSTLQAFLASREVASGRPGLLRPRRDGRRSSLRDRRCRAAGRAGGAGAYELADSRAVADRFGVEPTKLALRVRGHMLQAEAAAMEAYSDDESLAHRRRGRPMYRPCSKGRAGRASRTRGARDNRHRRFCPSGR